MRNNLRKTPTRAGGIIFDRDNTHIILVLNKDSYYKKEFKWGLPKGHLYDYEIRTSLIFNPIIKSCKYCFDPNKIFI